MPRDARPAIPVCSHCPANAVEQVRYAGVHLCADHFTAFVRRRVSKEVRKQQGFPTGSVIGVAVSGGKDSIVALHLVHEILRPRISVETGGQNVDGDVRMHVLTIDEGIEGYRGHGLDIARQAANSLGLPHHIASYKDVVGATMDEAHTVKGARNECSFCGVFRRASLNQLAKELGCTLLVTGHNLDDTAQAVLMNTTQGDVARLARMGPHLEPKDGLVPRRMPLRWIPEKEVFLTAYLNQWKFDDHECPYAVNSQRFMYRDILNRLEAATPGTRHALVRTLDTLRPLVASLPSKDAASAGLAPCAECGEPASGTICKPCTLGHEVRDRLAAASSR